MLESTDKDTLKCLIDKYGLSYVVNALSAICAEKADHVDSCYNATGTPDKTLSKEWLKASRKLDKLEESIPN